MIKKSIKIESNDKKFNKNRYGHKVMLMRMVMDDTEVEGEAEDVATGVVDALLHAQGHEEGLPAAQDARGHVLAHQLVAIGAVLARVVPRVHLHRVHLQTLARHHCNHKKNHSIKTPPKKKKNLFSAIFIGPIVSFSQLF